MAVSLLDLGQLLMLAADNMRSVSVGVLGVWWPGQDSREGAWVSLSAPRCVPRGATSASANKNFRDPSSERGLYMPLYRLILGTMDENREARSWDVGGLEGIAI